jgi:hypothetical protein
MKRYIMKKKNIHYMTDLYKFLSMPNFQSISETREKSSSNSPSTFRSPQSHRILGNILPLIHRLHTQLILGIPNRHHFNFIIRIIQIINRRLEFHFLNFFIKQNPLKIQLFQLILISTKNS